MRPRIQVLTILLLTFLLCASALAAAAPPAPDSDAAAWLRALYTALTAGEYKIAGGLILLGVTFALRTWGARLVPWFATRFGGLVLAFAVSLGGTLGIAFAVGADIELGTIAAAIGTAATAAGVWEWLKSYIPGISASNEKTKAAALPKARIVSS